MADETKKGSDAVPDAGKETTARSEEANERPAAVPSPGPATDDDEPVTERVDRGIADFVRRAVSAGVGAAARSKEDIVRVAATEMRGWLEHLNLNEEIAKALAKMVIEVKTEVRFRPAEDGKLVPEATNDVKVKGTPPR